MTIVILGKSYHDPMGKDARKAMKKSPWYIAVPDGHCSPTSTNPPSMVYHGFKTMEEREAFAYGWRVGVNKGNIWKFTKEGNWIS